MSYLAGKLPGLLGRGGLTSQIIKSTERHWKIDGILSRAGITSLQMCTLYLWPYADVAGHMAQNRLFYKLQHASHRVHMAKKPIPLWGHVNQAHQKALEISTGKLCGLQVWACLSTAMDNLESNITYRSLQLPFNCLDKPLLQKNEGQIPHYCTSPGPRTYPKIKRHLVWNSDISSRRQRTVVWHITTTIYHRQTDLPVHVSSRSLIPANHTTSPRIDLLESVCAKANKPM